MPEEHAMTMAERKRAPGKDVQRNLGYAFRDGVLLERALSHSSWTNEHGSGDHNERMEFLGDAVLELCVSDHLYRMFPSLREGDLTRLRARMVNTRSLAAFARRMGVADALLLGRGEERQGGRRRDALLADAMEAIFGGIYLDGGFEAVREVIARCFAPHCPDMPEPDETKDCKSRLQEVTQRLARTLPVYSLVDSSGPEHDKLFVVTVSVADGRAWTGLASSVRRAEHEAARQALRDLEDEAGE
jgi:ribonuclease-3